MGIFDKALLPEARNKDGDKAKLVRDRRGRLAVSRPSANSRRIIPAATSPTVITEVTDTKAVDSQAPIKQNPSKESVKAPSLKKSKESLNVEWGPADDLQLLELRNDRRSWDYIAGKMDSRGKDLAALKTRFNELGLQKARKVSKETEEESKDKNEESEKVKEDNKDEKSDGSSSEKGKKKKDKKKDKSKDKSRGEEDGAESDTASKKSEKGKKKTGGILKTSPKSDKTEKDGKQETARSEVQTTPVQTTPVENKRYVGRYGRGEVRILNGVPFLYQNAGNDAQPLDAVAVAMLMSEETKYDRNKWVTITSRLFDRTGIRMDPDVVRHAFEG